MRLVAVTRILNEDDIVEAFIRHHAAMVDHHILLDNGSSDGTLRILDSLQREGISLSVLQNLAPFFAETDYNTRLFKLAADEYAADWVIFIDTDEFIDARRLAGGLHARMQHLPSEVTCLSLTSLSYFDTPLDNSGELIVPRRMVRRELNSTNTKLFVRADLAATGVKIDAGQHFALYNDEKVAAQHDDTLVLAHYYRRSAPQALSKVVIGYLKVLAAGEKEISKNRNEHYAQIFKTLRDFPEQLLRQPSFIQPTYEWIKIIEDPIEYLGTALRYTQVSDSQMKAVRVIIAYAEQLARQHGTLIDSNEDVRRRSADIVNAWRKIM